MTTKTEILMQRKANDKEKILQTLINQPNGMLSSDIAELTKIPVSFVKRLLVGLRNKKEVFSQESKKRHSLLWFYSSKVYNETFCKTLDEEHEKWCKQINKPLYNPWGKA